MSPQVSDIVGKTVHIFDNDPQSIKTYYTAFEDTGFTVVVVDEKDAGITHLKTTSPEIIFADMDFQQLPGLTLLERVRAAGLPAPVVITGSREEDVLTAFRSGAVDFLLKPLDLSELRERISLLIDSGDNKHDIPSVHSAHPDKHDLERENHELSNLLKIASSIDISGDSKSILQQLSDLAADTMKCEGASILLKNEREQILEFFVATGEKGGKIETMTVPVGEGIAGWVARYGKPQIVNDTANDDRFTGKVDDESGFVTRQILAVPMIVEGDIIGVLEVINTRDSRLFEEQDLQLMIRMSERAALVIGATRMLEDQQNFFIQMTNIVVKAIEKKDMYSEGHEWRVAELCYKIGSALGLSRTEMNDLHFGALLHDIGKLDMPTSLFNKRNVTERDLEYMRQHPVKGAKLLEPVTMWKNVVPCILYHHEAWDGSGYPFGRSGNAIPLLARIINLAESFTVMRSPNSYKRQLTLKETILEIMRSAGKQFDPDIVKVLVQVIEKEYAERAAAY